MKKMRTKTKRLEKREKTGLENKEITNFAGFDPKTVSDDVIKFMTSSFDATFNNVVKIQDMNEKMLKEMLEKSKGMQADSVKMVNDFIENAKKGQDEYRKVMEDGFKKIEETVK
jgi:hypothetical protein